VIARARDGYRRRGAAWLDRTVSVAASVGVSVSVMDIDAALALTRARGFFGVFTRFSLAGREFLASLARLGTKLRARLHD